MEGRSREARDRGAGHRNRDDDYDGRPRRHRSPGRDGPGATGVVVASAPLQVSPGSMRVPSLRYGPSKRTVRVTLTVSEVGRLPVQGAQASVLVRRDGRFAFAGRKRTDRLGKTTFLVPRGSGCYRPR